MQKPRLVTGAAGDYVLRVPDIDLEPNKYRWRRPLSLPLAWSFVGLGCVMLGYIFFNRIHSDTEFFLVAFIAACVGGLLAEIMRNID